MIRFTRTTRSGFWVGLAAGGVGLVLVGASFLTSSTGDGIPVVEKGAAIALPDVVGVEAMRALLLLRDAGVPSAAVELRVVSPSGRPVGVVVSMDPDAGDMWFDHVVLEVTQIVKRMPDVVGLTVEAALAVLASSGVPEADVTIETVRAPDATKRGVVSWQHPQPYWENPYGIVLQVGG